jgi:glycosyltransferase involved in cell wall biosynthesis
MNLNPKIWGPHAWFFLDSIILSLPNKLNNEQKIIYKNFFTSLQYILPCELCREHYKENLNHPFLLSVNRLEEQKLIDKQIIIFSILKSKFSRGDSNLRRSRALGSAIGNHGLAKCQFLPHLRSLSL